MMWEIYYFQNLSQNSEKSSRILELWTTSLMFGFWSMLTNEYNKSN